jgi:formylglycine-generating enzyme required for sulfatase activity
MWSMNGPGGKRTHGLAKGKAVSGTYASPSAWKGRKSAITTREWNACVAAKSCTYVPTGKDDAPVANVSWNDAQDFLDLGKTIRAMFDPPKKVRC